LKRTRSVAIACIVVVVALVLVTFAVTENHPQNGPSNNPCPNSSETCLFPVRGAIGITPPSGAGEMNLTVDNVANYPLVGISVTKVAPSLGGLVASAPFSYNGMAIGAPNPVPIGGASSGSYTFTSEGANGTAYSITIMLTLSNGQSVTENITLVSEG